MYGITETTVHATYRPLTVEMAQRTASLIGCPIPDLRIYVLDEVLQPVAPGTTGELFIGGPGLARGYVNRPELTAERFLPHPFPDTAGERLYRSGDLARVHDTGDLEYLGRADNQVKVRGYRIELGEVETTLRGHPSVDQAVVIACDDGCGARQLVAYVAATAGMRTEPLELRRTLALRLPDYMIPSAFVILDTFPLNTNGKVDKAALAGMRPNANKTLDTRTPVS
jgi:acyl-CoA synthetase (AMP-forming)/AMP-acid ligase II